MSLANQFRGSIKNLGFGIRGLWLVVLYFLIIGFVIVSFSSFQFQNKVIQYPSQTDATSVDKTSIGELIEMIEKYQPLRDKLNTASSRLDNIQTNLQKAEEMLASAEGELLAEESKVNLLGETLLNHLDYKNITTADSENKISVPELDEFTSSMSYRVITKSVGLFGNDEEIYGLFNEYRQARSNYKLADGKWSEAQQLYRHFRRKISTENLNLDDAQRELEKFRKGKSERDFELLNELLAFRNISFLVFYLKDPLAIATMPTATLTLIVTLAMGALGSVLFLTTSFFRDRESMAFSWYIFRPFLGMITALAMFVFAKAGQITITEPSITTMQSHELNPFLVSFLAIISGLLSEQAIDRISRTGRGIFRGDTENNDQSSPANNIAVPPEFNLVEAFDQNSDKTFSNLAAHLNVTEEKIKRWYEGNETVPINLQTKIKIWFQQTTG